MAATSKADPPCVPTYDGKYIRYDISGNLFEIPAKYKPPIRQLGRGAVGIVCSAVNSETGEEVAVKKIGNAFHSVMDAKRIFREVKLLLHMDHENILAIRDIIRPPLRDEFEDVYIVSERMDTDLNKIIRSKQQLTEDHRRYFLYQLLRGLKYIHSASVLHRDLKPSNLLLNTNCGLKIGDFGLARVFSQTDFMTEYVVTRWYRAPELLLFCNEYTAAIDVWSVGCIFMELSSGRTLFPGRDHVHQLKLITELLGSPEPEDLGFLTNENSRRYVRQLPRFPKQAIESLPEFSGVHPDALDLIKQMLVFDPFRRITVEEAICHPYLATFHDSSDEPDENAPRFEYDFEQVTASLSVEDIREMIYMEALSFNPL